MPPKENNPSKTRGVNTVRRNGTRSQGRPPRGSGSFRVRTSGNGVDVKNQDDTPRPLPSPSGHHQVSGETVKQDIAKVHGQGGRGRCIEIALKESGNSEAGFNHSSGQFGRGSGTKGGHNNGGTKGIGRGRGVFTNTGSPPGRGGRGDGAPHHTARSQSQEDNVGKPMNVSHGCGPDKQETHRQSTDHLYETGNDRECQDAEPVKSRQLPQVTAVKEDFQPVRRKLKEDIYYVMKKEKYGRIREIETKYQVKISDCPLENDSEGRVEVLFHSSQESCHKSETVQKAIDELYSVFQETKHESHALPAGYKIGSLNVYVHANNITKLQVDGIINAANGGLYHAGGVAKAIADSAGPDLTRDSRRVVKDNGGEFVTSDVIRTTSGQLPCGIVLHAVGPIWPRANNVVAQDAQSARERECVHILRATFYNILVFSEMIGLNSIAIPPVSSGIFGVPHQHVVEEMAQAILCFVHQFPQSSLQHIHLVDIGEDIIARVSAKLRGNEMTSCLPFEEILNILFICCDQKTYWAARNRHCLCDAVPQSYPDRNPAQVEMAQEAFDALEQTSRQAAVVQSDQGKTVVERHGGSSIRDPEGKQGVVQSDQGQTVVERHGGSSIRDPEGKQGVVQSDQGQTVVERHGGSSIRNPEGKQGVVQKQQQKNTFESQNEASVETNQQSQLDSAHGKKRRMIPGDEEGLSDSLKKMNISGTQSSGSTPRDTVARNSDQNRAKFERNMSASEGTSVNPKGNKKKNNKRQSKFNPRPTSGGSSANPMGNTRQSDNEQMNQIEQTLVEPKPALCVTVEKGVCRKVAIKNENDGVAMSKVTERNKTEHRTQEDTALKRKFEEASSDSTVSSEGVPAKNIDSDSSGERTRSSDRGNDSVKIEKNTDNPNMDGASEENSKAEQ